MITWNEIESNAIVFSKTWRNCSGDERQEAQTFEKDFMGIFGVDWREGLHEYQVHDINGKIGYIDYFLPGKILIEMKSKGESLIRAYNQGYDYTKCLKPDEYPELLMVSDFEYIRVTNLRTMQTFKQFKISQLKNHVRMLGILAGYKSEVTYKTDIEVNIDASYKMAKLHDGLKTNGYIGKNLEIYLVRLLFCLFAEDTGIFEPESFKNYILSSKDDGSDLSMKIMALFSTLDTDFDKRMINLSDELKKFRYINGGLFVKQLPLVSFDKKMRKILLDCCDFNWSYISPAIFGAMFQGVMDEEERREMGAHYTSEDNILKLIKPLFLDDLWAEFEKRKSTKAELEFFHNKLANLIFLDPACGCGNFLIITYREIRLLEFEILKMLHDNNQLRVINTICKISIDQFYGIEYEEFACQIAQVGLLLMKHQMDKEVSNYFGMNLIDFPIRQKANIIHGNALKIDWNGIISKSKLSYIIGNPPFVGARLMNPEQKSDMCEVFGEIRGLGNLDYVTAWYKKASDMMIGTPIRTAFVSTNSIIQGEQAPILWGNLIAINKSHIDFAYRTFKWTNEAKGKAAVHCVIIGFSNNFSLAAKYIFTQIDIIKAKNINEYLLDADNLFLSSRKTPLCDVPKMCFGSMPNDDRNFLFSDQEKNEFLSKHPECSKWFKRIVGSEEYINNISRWCLWLKNITPEDIKKSKGLSERVENVRKYRLNSKRKATQRLANTPMLFGEIRQPDTSYIIIPSTSTQKRKYIPIGFLDKDTIASNAVQIIPNASLYNFGILTSNVHMAWMRAVAGRLKSDYRYSTSIVYNNFPWPNPNDKQIVNIEKAAQAILDVRAKYPESSLDTLYDSLYMPADLYKAHRNLDNEVCKAYGTIWKSEESCVIDIMKLYKEKINN